jgi:ABC-type branched-subunit amino acid transport system substrate-binding protein
VNAKGGVHGRLIKIIRYDDAFNGDKALENAKRLVEIDGAFALFGLGSGPSTAAVLPYATEKGIPVFGSLSGADSLRGNNPLVFHTRPSFSEEINRIAAHLGAVGIKRIAAMAADLQIGREGAIALAAAAKRNGLESPYVEKISADLKNINHAAAEITKMSPQAVLILAPAGLGDKFIEALRNSGYPYQLVGLSVLSSDALYKTFGEKAKGMILTQVVPFPWSKKLQLVLDYQKLMVDKNIPVSIDTMEGYLAARILVEGLKAAGPKPTRHSFTAALEAMGNKELGGYFLTFSPERHVATTLVDITMIGSGGRLIN